MVLKVDQVIHANMINKTFNVMLSHRELTMLSNSIVNTDIEDSLVGQIEDLITNIIENRKSGYNVILTLEDVKIRFNEWCHAHNNDPELDVNIWEWFQFEIDAEGIQIIQNPNPD